MEGRVFEITVPEEEVEAFGASHLILAQRQEGERVSLRFTDGNIPAGAVPAVPTLEDAFLAIYR